MSTLAPKPSASSHGSTPRNSINTESVLPQIDFESQYTVRRELGRGTYGRCVLVICNRTGRQLALKLLDKRTTKMKDFLHEFNTSLFLSAHPQVIDVYSVAFETVDSYSFALEYAPLGDLFEFIQPGRGLPEATVKLVASQLTSALEFMHSEGICHRDLKPENVAVFEADLTLVKVVDFGMARSAGTLCRKVGPSIPYTPPEIAQAATNETYRVHTGTDVWSLGILIYCSLTGSFPWQLAKESDPSYAEFEQWQRRKAFRPPTSMRQFATGSQSLLRRLLEPRLARRAAVGKVRKFLSEDWTIQVAASGCRQERPVAAEDTAFCGSEATLQQLRLRHMLERFNVATCISRRAKELRVVDWVSSVSPTADAADLQAECEC